MCGLIFYKSNNSNVDVNSCSQIMLDAISHRGPDGTNLFFYENHNLAIGHNRLAIIDLDERAAQPMSSACKKYKLVFNGEIYNYKEIRRGLIAEGYEFTTNSDTEVILKSYMFYGVECFDFFDGMFSVVLIDEFENKIIVSRDKRGVKPLYIYKTDTDFAIGSELKALKPFINKLHLNKQALGNFLIDGFISGEDTPFDDVFKYKKGITSIYDLCSNELIEEIALSSSVMREDCDSLEDALVKGVESRFVADVPVGIFLSGGVDSTLVAAVAKRKLNLAPICFTLGLDDDSRDESIYAAKIAKDLNLQHKIITVTSEQILNRIHNIFDVYDEPFADISSILTIILSEFASKHVKVVLSADGGDELFLGYKRQKAYNSQMLRILRCNSLLSNSVAFFLKKLAILLPSKSYKLNKISGILNSKDNIHSYRHFNGTFNADELILPLTNKAYYHPFCFDFDDYMPNDIFYKVDRASMKFGLEAREPFMHDSIYKFSNIKSEDLSKSQVGKKELDKILHDLYPDYNNITKSGFSFSLQKISKFLFYKESIDWNIIINLNLITSESIERLKLMQSSNDSSEIQKLFFLFILCGWVKKWGINV